MARPKKSEAISSSPAKKSSLGIKPLAGYVLVEPSEAETKTTSGILLPETAQERPAQGEVLVVGDDLWEGTRQIMCPVQVGQTVLYKKWGGDEIKVGGTEYKLVKFEDIMAIME